MLLQSGCLQAVTSMRPQPACLKRRRGRGRWPAAAAAAAASTCTPLSLVCCAADALRTQMQAAAHAGGGLLGGDDSWGTLALTLPLRHPSKAQKAAGDIQLEVTWRPSCTDQPTRMLGPCRFQQTLSPTAGVLTGVGWRRRGVGGSTGEWMVSACVCRV